MHRNSQLLFPFTVSAAAAVLQVNDALEDRIKQLTNTVHNIELENMKLLQTRAELASTPDPAMLQEQAVRIRNEAALAGQLNSIKDELLAGWPRSREQVLLQLGRVVRRRWLCMMQRAVWQMRVNKEAVVALYDAGCPDMVWALAEAESNVSRCVVLCIVLAPYMVLLLYM